MKQVWTSDDGCMIGSKQAVSDYEYQQKNPLATAIKKVEECWSVRTLLESTPRSTVGSWEIREEDPNCDFGGHHHQPYMATVSGTLSQAIEYAAKSNRFFGWGAGGSIKKIDIIKL